MILSHERVQICARKNLCSYATNPPHFRVRELLLCDILITFNLTQVSYMSGCYTLPPKPCFHTIMVGCYGVNRVYRGFSCDVTAAKSCKSRYSQLPCWIFFCPVRCRKSHKICSHSILLNLHKAKLYRSNNVINIYSLTASLTCSNKMRN